MTSEPQTQYLAFDVYGTLLDTSAVASAVKTILSTDEEKSRAITSLWRRYQLEYTWRMNSMGIWEPFDAVTRRSLMHASAEVGFSITAEQCTGLMDVYNHLQPFDDALRTIQTLSGLPNVKLIVFSNGTPPMVSTALEASGLAPVIPETFLADNVRRYKPSPVIYEGLISHINNKETPPIASQNVWLVSGNPFDITGARAAGLRAIWVDRSGSGWVDQLAPQGLELGPNQIVRGLDKIPELIRQFA